MTTKKPTAAVTKKLVKKEVKVKQTTTMKKTPKLEHCEISINCKEDNDGDVDMSLKVNTSSISFMSYSFYKAMKKDIILFEAILKAVKIIINNKI
jgi:hypothetical protein